MSLVRIYSVHCDGRDCLEWVGGEDSGAEARRLARRSGWYRKSGHPAGVTNLDRSGYDLCPACRQGGEPS